jgi:hypothetical protein
VLPHHDESPDAESAVSITRGATVFDAAGEKIGTVREVRLQERCVVVRRRRLLPEDIDVPLRVIARIGADGVYLDLYKEEVLNRDWGAPPVSEARSDAEEPLSPVEAAPGASSFQKSVSDPGDFGQDHGDGRRGQSFVAGGSEAAAGEKGTYKDALSDQPDPKSAVDAEEPRLPGTKA